MKNYLSIIGYVVLFVVFLFVFSTNIFAGCCTDADCNSNGCTNPNVCFVSSCIGGGVPPGGNECFGYCTTCTSSCSLSGSCYLVAGVCVQSGWNWCLNSTCWDYCGSCATPTPTPGPGATSTPTPIPPSAPSCAIAGPSSVTTTDNPTYTITSSTNANRTGIYKYPPSSWPTICESSGNCSGSTQFASPGPYWVVCNAYNDSTGLKCSGSPFELPSGWTDCGSSSRIQVTVTPPPTCCGATFPSCITPGTSFTVTANCVSNATQVKFPTWSSAGGQDDLVWYTDSNGAPWQVSIPQSSHPGGDINVHVYMDNGSYTNVWCDGRNNIPLCTPTPIPYTYSWAIGNWGPCNNCSQSRSVYCRRSDGAHVTDDFCPVPKPATTQACGSVNGVCSNPDTHYSCTAGTSINNDGSSTSAWTWRCGGLCGGSGDVCSENKPACQVTTSPSVLNLIVGGGTRTVTASVTSGLAGETITGWAFSAYDTGIATVAGSGASRTVTALACGNTAVWATATLSDGRICETAWNTDTDVNVSVNGVCSNPDTHYSCITGTSASNGGNAAAWTWDCSGCGGGTTAHCSENKPASCTLSLAPATVNPLIIGNSTTLTATATAINGTIASITFTSGTLSVATVSPASDTTSPYTTTVSGVSSGTSTITANGTMTGGGACTPDTSVITVPQCTVELNPHPGIIMVHGDKATFTASLTNIIPSSVSFSSNNTDVVSISPLSDTTSPYITTGTAVFPGSAILTASAIYNGVSKCSDTSNVTVNPRGAWWQVIDGDVQTNGNLYSDVPPNLYFGLPGLGGFPGVAKYGGSTSLSTGNVSNKGWLANSSYAPPNGFQNYSYFRRMIPEDVVPQVISSSSVAGSSFESGGTFKYNYYWYEYSGSIPLSITTPMMTLASGRKVILLVTGTDLNIQAKINYTAGASIFVALVDGNINIDPSVGGAAYDLQGFFLADGNISTGVSATPLHVKGSVAALGGINLQRNLGGLNMTTPAEVFEYDPAGAFLFPPKLSIEKTRWKEVAP